MAFLNFLYDNGLWLSVLGFAGGLILLAFFIRRIIRLRSEKLILSVPLRAEQSLEFTEAGRVVLAVEGPLFTNRFARTGFELRGGDGLALKGDTTLLRAHSSTFSRIRMEMKSYELPMPGRYELRILNLGTPQPRDNEHQIVFMKPHLPQLVVAIVGIVGSSFLFIGSIVLFLLRSLGI